MEKKLAFLCAFAATILFGFIGIFNRDLNTSGLGSIQISFIRMFVTTLTIGVMMLLFSRSSFRLKKKDLWLFAMAGIVKVGADIFFLRTQITVALSLATVLQNMAPYFVLAISYFLFKEKISTNKIIAVVVGTIGCVLIIGIFDSAHTASLGGVLYGLGSAFCIALFYICGKTLADRGYGANTVTFYGFAIGTLAIVLFADIPTIVSTLSNDRPLILDALALGIVCTAIPYYLTQLSYSGLDAAVVSVIGMCEILFSALVGFIFFKEAVTVSIAIGMALVILSVIILDGSIDLRKIRKKRMIDRE